ncbi:chromo domain-containing protein [Aspergillus thermomutatus]|uniref:Chromo domain-containing protein n=1 Tax=Aspergillus thermomutatus TaxID=41047 RepID=A0A397HNT9_ASPTH|nr:uncharacterized protein CDV56_103545 [Aspergillus thermomutatus]RHZ62130.1 hypothetical protein CDV56_103545 [Aspergillus thermomutatus]
MPPPVEDLSDSESTGESIPYNNVEDEKDVAGDAKEEEEDDDEIEEEGVYTVEKIMGHKFTKDGKLMLQVKWHGYEDPADQTLEPEENLLEGAKDVLDEYYKAQGGRPEKPVAVRKRKSMGSIKAEPEKPAEPKRRRKSRADADTSTETPEAGEVPDWVPRSKSWENDVARVDTIVRDPKTNSLIAFLHWTNGKTSKMLKFYEQHLVFKDS